MLGQPPWKPDGKAGLAWLAPPLSPVSRQPPEGRSVWVLKADSYPGSSSHHASGTGFPLIYLFTNPLSPLRGGQYPPHRLVADVAQAAAPFFALCLFRPGKGRPDPERAFMKEKKVLVVFSPQPQGPGQRMGVCPRQLEQSCCGRGGSSSFPSPKHRGSRWWGCWCPETSRASACAPETSTGSPCRAPAQRSGEAGGRAGQPRGSQPELLLWVPSWF